MLSVFICLFVFSIILASVHYLKTYNYWKIRGIQCSKPVLPIIGNLYDIFLLRPAIDIIIRLYNSLDAPFFGFYVFSRPVLMLKDPELIKQILISDFNKFVDRGFKTNPEIDPLAKNLVHLKENDWKVFRPKLVSCFSMNKVKNMFSVMNEYSIEVMEVLNNYYEKGVDFECLDLSNRFMVDCIMTNLFGVKSNCVKDPNAEFNVISKHILGIHFIKHAFIGMFSPWLHSLLGITMCSPKYTKLFKSVMYDNIKFRQSVKSNSRDFFKLLLEMKEQYEAAVKSNLKVEGPVIDENFIIGQLFIFYAAGFESPANTIAFCMYELTQNKDIQDKVYREVESVLKQHENQITYEAIQEMKYLNQVFAETMRKYPALNLIFRESTKDYKIQHTDVTIEAGTLVLIPTHGLHYDAKYYPKPDVFDPERFNEKSIEKIHPGTYLPYGIGPRNCPASLLSNINMKVLIIRILQVYKISLTEKTKAPISFNPMQFILTPHSSGVWLKLEKR